MPMPKQILDQLSAYRAHSQKARDHLSKANYEAKKLLIERGLEVNAQDHDYQWSIFGKQCPDSPIGVCVYDTTSDTHIYCIYCEEMGDWSKEVS